jgi:GntR family transcriptional regulator
MGFEPGMEQHLAQRRPATAAEAEILGLEPGEEILAMERMILADHQAVAFSYDILPIAEYPPDIVEAFGAGSMFGTFERAGIVPVRALAELHAISDESIGWGPQKPTPALYLLLDQLHFDQRGKPVAYSRTYFVEGRFQFVVLRTR